MKRFRIQDERGDTVAGMDAVGVDNVYVSTYGKLLPGQKRPAELAVDEHCKKEYSLSGQRPTVYVIVRTE